MKQYILYTLCLFILFESTLLISINDDIASPTCWVNNPQNPNPINLPPAILNNYESHIFDNTRNIVRMVCIGPCFLLGAFLGQIGISTSFLSPIIYFPTKLLTKEESSIAEGTHDFLNHDEKVTVGFRTKINNTTNITKFLPEIIENILITYPYHYTKSSGFNLEINNNQNSNFLYITLRKKAVTDLQTPSPRMPQVTDYLVRNNKVNNIIESHSFLSLTSEDDERNYSDQEAKRYKQNYGKDINEFNQIPKTNKQTYISPCIAGAFITLIIALLFKLFSKKKPITEEKLSQEETENIDEDSDTEHNSSIEYID